MGPPIPEASTLHLYRSPSAHPPLPWAWVDRQLTDAGTYWVVACARGRPHPRPVWGVWHQQQLHLSIGSPGLRTATTNGADVAVHLDSGTDVVVVEGRPAPPSPTGTEVLAAYDAKYDWTYQADQYGQLTVINPVTILAWRTAGFAGRDSFQQTGRWAFPH